MCCLLEIYRSFWIINRAKRLHMSRGMKNTDGKTQNITHHMLRKWVSMGPPVVFFFFQRLIYSFQKWIASIKNGGWGGVIKKIENHTSWIERSRQMRRNLPPLSQNITRKIKWFNKIWPGGTDLIALCDIYGITHAVREQCSGAGVKSKLETHHTIKTDGSAHQLRRFKAELFWHFGHQRFHIKA